MLRHRIHIRGLSIAILSLAVLWGCGGHANRLSTGVGTYESSETVLVVMYIGSPTCTVSSRHNVIEAVSRIPTLFSQHHAASSKFVFISMDSDLDESLAYLRNHGEGWDEVSLGARYNNEILLSYFNSEELPGTPHILVFEDQYDFDRFQIPQRRHRERLMTLLGGDEIIRWVNENVPLTP